MIPKTDKLQCYRLISQGKHVRRFFPVDALTPEGWLQFYTDSPIDYAATLRVMANNVKTS